MPNGDSPILVDGSMSFEGGVNSLKPTTIASQHNPGGLARNELAWLINGSVRDGGITPRNGWQPLYKILDFTNHLLAGTSGWQGGLMYEPLGANPYIICSIGGEIFLVDPASLSAVDLSAKFNLFNPPNVDHAYFVQGERFAVIQAGDGKTLPLFWDGVTLRRSNGLQPTAASGTIISTNNQSFVVPLAGDSVNLTWTSVAGLAVNSTVIIYIHGTSTSYGTYLVTNIAGTTLTLQKLDFNQAPFHITGNFDLVIQTAGSSSELPAGYAMDYFMQRIWYVFGDLRVLTAGDIVGNTSSGTAAYNFTDSILKVTENPLAIGGDGFRLPSNSGNIRALAHSKNINAALGQGQLYIFTRKQVYGLNPPVTRADWINTNNTNAPLLTVVQLNNGATGDRCIVPVNGDLYYQSLEPGVRSIVNAVQYFGQPGNVPISAPENRIIQFDNRALLSFATGIEADNLLMQSALPKRVSQGTVHQAIMPLDFTPITTPGSTLPPTWEGHHEGLDFLQLFTGDFGGLQRSFQVIVSRTDGSIWLWEIVQGELFDNGDSRIFWQAEFPAFTWGKEFDLKRLVGAELWIDRLFGTVEFVLEYRPDGAACYIPWHKWKVCSARDCAENIPPTCVPQPYPAPTTQGDGYRQTMTLPKPPVVCDKQMARPSDLGHQFQPRLTIHGACRVRGIFLLATAVERKTYSNPTC